MSDTLEQTNTTEAPPEARQPNGTNGSAEQARPTESKASPVPAAKVAEPKKRPWLKPLLLGLLAIGVVFGLLWGVRYFRFAQTHVSTDDAYVTGNLVNVSPIISGTLQQLLVDEGNYVRQGQLIARLDDAGPRSSLRQAQANYNAALTQIPQAERNLRYQQQATDAAIHKAQATLASQQAKTSGAAQQVTLASGTTRNQVRQAQSQILAAQAQSAQAQAQARASEASVENYQQAVLTAQASLENYQQQVQTAQKALQAAQARVTAAQSEAERSAKDEQRYRVLYTEDAVSAQVYDNARSQARNAQATLQANQSQADEAQSQVESARSSVKQAQSQVEQARKNVTQAQAQARASQRAADAAQEQVRVAQAGLGLAQANSTQVGIQQANLLSTTRQTGESEADVANAQAGQEQVAVRRKQIDTYRAQAEQAHAALINAQITFNDTAIYAPKDGTVVRKTANVGASLSPGQTILTMTQGDYVWVEANFKETQLGKVRPGQEAEVEVDAFPGKVFKGRVHSINEATGAATSLLPPDNATGNFTKVVQRVPVRIELIPASDNDDAKYARSQDIHNLRQGMSVTATIDTHSGGSENGQSGEQPNRIGSNAPTGSNIQGEPSGMSGVGGAMQASPDNNANPSAPPTDAPNGANSANAGSSAASSQSGTNGSSPPNTGNGQSGPVNSAPVPNNIPNPGVGTLDTGGQSGVPNANPSGGGGNGMSGNAGAGVGSSSNSAVSGAPAGAGAGSGTGTAGNGGAGR